MTLWWMAYVVLAGLPVALATWGVARLLRRRNRGERWVWLTGLILSLALPAIWIGVGLLPASGSAPSVGPVVALSGLDIGPPALAASGGPSLTMFALAGWVLLSLGMAGWLGVSAVTLDQLRRAAPRRVVGGRALRVSSDVGPAVVGFVRPDIVVPSWVLELEPAQREWILRHEEEHVRAHDPLVLFVIQFTRVLAPWNPITWLLGAGLRQGIEIDCDRRVLRSRPEPAAYGHMLLHALVRQNRPLPIAAAFSFRQHDLEQRISTMILPRRALGFAGTAVALVGVALVATTCMIPVPTDLDTDDASALETAQAGSEAISDGPTFTPYTDAPDLTNRREVQVALEEHYPPELRDAGIGGMATIWFYVSDEGEVVETQLKETSGHSAIDEAALSVANTFEFTPALNRDEPVAVWVAFPITFMTQTPRAEPDAEVSRGAQPDAVEAPAETGPRLTPYTVAPDLANRTEVGAALEEHYPPLLRDAGIGGAASVWMFISEEGEVVETQLKETSGHRQLDEAALRVAGGMRFTPALNRDEPTAVWVSLPITFENR